MDISGMHCKVTPVTFLGTEFHEISENFQIFSENLQNPKEKSLWIREMSKKFRLPRAKTNKHVLLNENLFKIN